ncbi:MAG TPA: hypothetical protein VIH92_06280 [Solirubrobacteraceae bacterium]
MSTPGLRASPDANAAAWIVSGVRGFDDTVGSIVPPVFEAYARVFHPAARGSGTDEAAVSWAEVASANGRVMHPAAEWGSLTGSWRKERSRQPGLWDTEPATGRIPCDVAERLAAILSGHSAMPSLGFFAVWDGWGIPMPMFLFTDDTPEEDRKRARDASDAELGALRGLIHSAATFQVPHRRMHLLTGPVAAIEDFDLPGARRRLCGVDPPLLWWPADEVWCVGTDIDLMTTYVGGSGAAIEALLADGPLEALQVQDTQSVTWEADTINPLPGHP